MNSKVVGDWYRAVMSLNTGARFVKFDLHVHSPESHDFVRLAGLDERSCFLSVLDNAVEQGIEIIAITDHNTFSGYNKIMEYLRMDPALRSKYAGLLILCGIEITCFSKHILAVFDDLPTDKQDRFLEQIGLNNGISPKDEMADMLGPAVLLAKIAEYEGIAILAHADTQEGFLYSFCRAKGERQAELNFSGKSLAKIVTSPHLYGIQVANDSNRKRLRDILRMRDYSRPEDRALAMLRFSDSHGNVDDGKYLGTSGKQLGSAYSLAKLSHISFQSLKMALCDASIRIVDEEPELQYPIVLGCAIKSDVFGAGDQEPILLRFNPEMNCVIGARGTGKSTLLEIIQHVLTMDRRKSRRDASTIEQRFSCAVVFVAYKNTVYAFVEEPVLIRNSYTNEVSSDYTPKVYVKNSKNRFKRGTPPASIRALLTLGYRQRQLYEYHKHPNMILEIVDDFIKWKHQTEYEKLIKQIEHNVEALRTLLTRIQESMDDYSFVQRIERSDQLRTIAKHRRVVSGAFAKLHNMRCEMVESLNHLLRGKVTLALSRRVPQEDYTEMTKSLPWRASRIANRYYDYQVTVSNAMRKVVSLSSCHKETFDFFDRLLENQLDKIIDDYGLQGYVDRAALQAIRQCVISDDLLVFMDSSIHMEYNINSGIKGSAEVFRSNNNLSMGQNAVALLLLVLNAAHNLDDNRPLIMDQPEDDLDNSYIYTTLVNEFRKSKQKRQVLISTHNANIPVAADAENILVLKYDGNHGYVATSGSLDSPQVSTDVIDILEGGKEAIERRNRKYGLILK